MALPRGQILGVSITMARKENKMKLLGMKDTIKFNESGEEFAVTGFTSRGIELTGVRGNLQTLTSHDFENLLKKKKIKVITTED